MSFNFQEYQELAVRSLKDEATLEMLALHLVEKVGAIAGIKYKALKIGSNPEMIEIWLTEELGWCLWCVAAIAHRINELPAINYVFSPEAGFLSSGMLPLVVGDICHKDELLPVLMQLAISTQLIARTKNLDISAIASINLAKVAR